MQVIGRERNVGIDFQKLEFSEAFRHLGDDFYEELNQIYMELFESPVGYTLGTPLDVNIEDKIDEVTHTYYTIPSYVNQFVGL